MAKECPRPMSFTDRIRPRQPQPHKSPSPIAPESVPAAQSKSAVINEEENNYPFAYIDFVRVGSAHAVCEPHQDAENIDLMLRISTHVLRRNEPDLLPAKVSVEYKPNASSSAPGNDQITHTAAMDSPSCATNHFEVTFLDRRWLKGLYLCVLVQGQLPSGDRGYCYFGVFADTLVEFVDRYQPKQLFNPKQLKAIVLVRSAGAPSSEIREFMRMKFRFEKELVVLEISRSGG